MARPLGPPPVAENRLTWPSRLTREQRLLRISVSTIEPSVQATGPSGKPRPVATMVTSLMVIVSPLRIASGMPVERSSAEASDAGSHPLDQEAAAQPAPAPHAAPRWSRQHSAHQPLGAPTAPAPTVSEMLGAHTAAVKRQTDRQTDRRAQQGMTPRG